MKILGILFAMVALIDVPGAVEPFKDDFTASRWSNWKSATAVGAFSHNKEIGKTAPGCLEIDIGPNNPDKTSFCFTRRLPAEPGKTYTATVYARSTGMAKKGGISLNFQGQNEKKQFMGTPVRSCRVNIADMGEDWQLLNLNFTVPTDGKWAECRFLLCSLGAAGSPVGKVYFDDFEYKEDKPWAFAQMWGNWKSAKAVGRFLRAATEGRTFPGGALEINVGPDNPPRNASLVFLNRFAVVPGKTYTGVVYVKGKELGPNARISLGFQGQNEKKQFLGLPAKRSMLQGEAISTDEWKRIVLTFKIPTDGKWASCRHLLCTIGVNNTTSGQVFFDDFEFFDDEAE